MKIILNIVKYITISALVIIVIGSLILFVEKKFNLTSYPNILGLSVLNVSSGSMDPTIKVNDKILTLVSTVNEVEVNDIVVYSDDNIFVTHRLIEKKGSSLVTKGDYNNTTENIYEGQIVAKVILYGKSFTRIMNILLNPLYLVAIALIGFIIPDYILSKMNKS